MSAVRISMVVEDHVFAALSLAADEGRRDLREQAALLITEGLQRRGLLAKKSDSTGQDAVADPSRASEGNALIISASARPSTDGGQRVRK
jgi:hypothetical protein